MKFSRFILSVLTAFIFLYGSLAYGLSQEEAIDKRNANRDEISHHGFLEHLVIPLYADFKEIKEESVMFDSEFGRIIAAKAKGTASLYRVMDFYRSVLPRLGWDSAGKVFNFREADCYKEKCVQRWHRDKEELSLTIVPQDNVSTREKRLLVISYSLRPF